MTETAENKGAQRENTALWLEISAVVRQFLRKTPAKFRKTPAKFRKPRS